VTLARVLIVDDSSSVRSLLSQRLGANGYAVEDAVDGESATEKAIAHPPDVVVTDLHMKGISGVQLCRILRNEPATAHVPVVLLTASGDKRSRFWARSAGAAAYVGKDRIDDLVTLLPRILTTAHGTTKPAPSAAVVERESARRVTPQERMSAILDAALFDSVIAGEVRALASAGDHARLFDGLIVLLSDVLTYRWMAVLPSRSYTPLFVHAHPDGREGVEVAARATTGALLPRSISVVADDRAVPTAAGPVDTWPIVFGGSTVGIFALAQSARPLSRDDRRMVSLVANELGGPLEMCGLVEDAQRLAAMDGLTELLNRRAFLEFIGRERARSDRHAFALSLLLLDVDHFKAVNDSRGHAAGDAVLKGVARVLVGAARASDVIARWGGEEFVVGLTQTGESGARIAAERIRRAIAEASYPCPEGEPLRITASIGAASADAPWKIEALVAAADAAMYAAKARGRNRVEVVSPTDPPGEKRPRAKIG
jgi:two-component system cell cycle response regulator